MSTMPSTTRVGLILSATIFAFSAPVILQKLDPPEKPAKVDRLDRLSFALPPAFVFHETAEAICKDEPKCLGSASSVATGYSLAHVSLANARMARYHNPGAADEEYNAAYEQTQRAGKQWATFVKQYAK